MLLIKCLSESRHFVSLKVWSIQVWFNTMTRRKDISNDLLEAIVAAHQCGKGYKDISKQFAVYYCSVKKDHSQGKYIQDSCQSSSEWMSQHVHLKVRLCKAQRNWEKSKSHNTDNYSLSEDIKSWSSGQYTWKKTECGLFGRVTKSLFSLKRALFFSRRGKVVKKSNLWKTEQKI